MASIQKRVSTNGTVSYRVEVRLKGYPPQRATFRRKTDAGKWGQSQEAAIRERRHFKTAEAQKHTLAELVDRYIKDVLPTKPKQARDQSQQLGWWRDEIGAYTLADVTPALISQCRDKLLAGKTNRGQRSPSTVTRYMAALSHAFTVAVNEWGWMENSPMRKVKKPREPRGRVRFLSEEERERLLEACLQSNNPYLYLVVVIALSTGMRQGEIMGMTWDEVDLTLGRITLYDTKNREIRVVPLAGRAFELMSGHAKVKRTDSRLVFPSKTNAEKPIDLRTPWIRALRGADIENFRFHDLRHSAASYLAMNGASLTEIAEVLGHKTLAMVSRYAHLSEAHTANVVSSMNAKIFGEK